MDERLDLFLASCRAKNMASILMKSAIDTCISAICYYLVGYAFTVGQSNPTNGEIPRRTAWVQL
jgi:ammonia channel protein AmtB